MAQDGRDTFFRSLNLDKSIMQTISAFIDIKNEMMKEDTDSYSNGRKYIEE